MKNILDPLFLNYTVQTTDRYTLLLLNCRYSECTSAATCPQSVIAYELSYSLLNPNNDQISATDWPLVLSLPFVLFLWVALFCVSIFCCLIPSCKMESEEEEISEDSAEEHHESEGEGDRDSIIAREVEGEGERDGILPPERRGRREEEQFQSFERRAMRNNGSYRLHLLCLSALISKALLVLLTIYYWNVFALKGQVSSFLSIAHTVFISVSECVLFCVLLMLGHGWGIVNELDENEIRSLSSSLIALLSSLLFFSMYDTITSFLILYVFLLPNIFSNINLNAEGLRFRLMWVEAVENQIQEQDRPVWRWILMSIRTKYDFFDNLKSAITLYFLSMLILNVASIFMAWYMEPITSVALELFVFLFVSYLVFLIRPSQATVGLFWPLNFGDGNGESHAAWVEASRRIFQQISSGEHQINQKMMQTYQSFMKNIVLVQYPSRHIGKDVRNEIEKEQEVAETAKDGSGEEDVTTWRNVG